MERKGVIILNKYFKRILKYFGKHQKFADIVHVLGGIGFGIMLARPFAGDHPLRWGVAFLALSAAGHVWAATH